jgi:hypothetical protein
MPRRLIPLACFVLPYTAAAFVVSIAQHNFEFVYYSTILALLVLGVWYLDRRVHLPTWVLWALALWGFIHLMGGVVPIPNSLTEPGSPANLYNLRLAPWLPKYDQVVHALGFGVASIAGWHALRATYTTPPHPGIGHCLAIVLLGMGLGAVNEVIEFVATRLMPWTNVGGYDNTGWDLTSNLVGCIGAGLFLRACPARPQTPHTH